MMNHAKHDDTDRDRSMTFRRTPRGIVAVTLAGCLIASFTVGRVEARSSLLPDRQAAGGLEAGRRSPAAESTASTLQQYRAGGHVLGFDRDGYYVSNGTYAMRVEFVGAASGAPVADGAASTEEAAAPLGRVTYDGLWPGIRAEYDAPPGAILRSTWHVAPGADPDAIRLRYNSALSVNPDGSLSVSFATGATTETAPVAWQEIDGTRRPVAVAFAVLSEHEVRFRVGAYRPDLPLVIDPTLTWNTFLGDSGADVGNGIAVDGSGNVYVAGQSSATWGTPVRAYTAGNDGFAAKLTSAGALTWNTFLGGSGADGGNGIAVDGSGNVYVTGQSSATWGTPVRAYTAGSINDGFAAKLTSAGALTWNTFLGGSGADGGNGIAVDGSGNVYAAGQSSATWGTPVRAYTAGNDGFAAKLTSAGALTWHAFLGGSGGDFGNGIAVDGSGNVYVAGQSGATWGTPVRAYTAGNDGFAAKLTSAGALTWNTFLGGAGAADAARGIAVDGSGNVYVAGQSNATWGTPVRAFNNGDGFAVKLTSAGALTWNTFLGGSGPDAARGIAVDGSGNVYVAGDSPATWGTPWRAFTINDAFAAKLTSAGALTWNAFLGGTGVDVARGIAVDGSGNVYVAGLSDATWGTPVRAYTASSNPSFPTFDAFAAKINDASAVCGNSTIEAGEQCDDGNTAGGDCCSSTCQYESSGSPCGSASDTVCDNPDTCNGAGSCQSNNEPNTTVCRADAGECDVAESCDGAGSCPADAFEPSGTACGSASDTVCDNPDTCNASGSCQSNNEPNTTVCRADAGECDVAESCDGAGSCPADAFEPSGTACGSASDTVCDNPDTCNGAGSCQINNEPNTTVCRASAGVCDAAENCTGSGSACPADGFASTATVCRASVSTCDATENCTGSATACPGDGFASSATGCRASAGVCDVAETCTGSGVTCPSDTVASSATVCRSVAGVCDVAENCDGAAVDCPADAYLPSSTGCRAVVDVCDVSESCTGSGPNCPADAFASSATICRGATDICDLTENCTGSSAPCPTDAVEPPVTVCRPAASTADAPESCDGSNKFCPADLFLPAGTPCDDGSFCTQRDEADGFGVCVGLDPVDCDDINPCTDDTCDSQAGGFLCEHMNNGLCIGPNCGNFVIDTGDGETCDPPNLALDPITNQIECRLDCTACGDGVVQANNTETCDDGNTTSGCRPDKPQQPLDSCLNNCNEPICADPARIKFGKPGQPDLFYFHGRLISDVPVDFVNNHFVIELRDNAGAVIYRSSLIRGSIEVQNVKSTRYKNGGAREGGGVYQFKSKAGAGHYVLTLKTYGDLRGSVADMTTHVYVADDEWVVRGMWTPQGTKGWKLSNKATFLPVP